jgi:hypothetical protein
MRDGAATSKEDAMTLTKWKWIITVSLLAYVSVSLLAVSQTKPVLVVNTPAQPVPIAAQGTTNVAGTVNLSSGAIVNIGNTPNVNVSNTPSVNVANTPTVSLAGGTSVSVTNPLDGQNNPGPLATLEAVQPYDDQCQMSFAGTFYGQCNFRALPAGKRLVIQEFDAVGQLQTSSKPIYISLLTTGINYHSFTATFMGTGFGYDNFVTHQETRLYSGPNATPLCSVAITPASNPGYYTCLLSGFLVDVP